jgi:hypothetical protein
VWSSSAYNFNPTPDMYISDNSNTPCEWVYFIIIIVIQYVCSNIGGLALYAIVLLTGGVTLETTVLPIGGLALYMY